MKLTVAHYGLHELASGVRFLFQEGGVTSPPGLDLSGQLDVKIADRFAECPHRIRLKADTKADPDLLPDHPLVNAFLPLPFRGGGAIYLEDGPYTRDVVRQLKRLASPSIYDRECLLQIREKPRVYKATNIMPLVFGGFHWQWPQQPKKVEQWAAVGTRRPVILLPTMLAEVQPGYLETWDLSLEELRSLPLEDIGARVVLDYLMHRETWAA